MPAPLGILLIGGTGFLGHHVAAALIAAGHQVTVLSRGTRQAPAGAESLIAERGDRKALGRALEGRRFDLTVDFLVYDAPDVEILLLVPYAALGRYVMISTGQVYLVTEGARAPYREDESEGTLIPEPADPDSYEHASWTYGVAKRRAEQTLLGLRDTHGVRTVILRLPIIQGEGDGSRRLWAYLERMLDGGPLVLPDGGGSPARFVYAGDVARLITGFATDPPRSAVYNVAQPDLVPVRAFLDQAGRLAGVAPRIVDATWEECREAGLDESFSPYAGRWRSTLDASKAATELGFLGSRTEEYLPGVVRWHLEHRMPSHRGYALRDREIELAARLATRAGPSA
ncbi:MAG TPA: NAD-dependent epimerase/dehydratase family protein [Candidatus Eisenbacteria bacterium]|nr:NAD-dependent epimerase/dehydratase family protein [Candidatus Eisenbacteria bacterium]